MSYMRQELPFKDKNLLEIIERKLLKDQIKFHELDVLFANEKRVTSISGLEQCKKLYSLNISDNNISDISCLENLKRLTEIDLRKTPVSCLKPLINLKNLRVVHLPEHLKRDDKNKAYRAMIHEILHENYPHKDIFSAWDA